MDSQRRIIREAIAIALEGLSGPVDDWVEITTDRAAMREHVISWVKDFARNRGVLLEDTDVTAELSSVIVELRSKNGLPRKGKK